jgi:mono/diheme cytochrome c family protein
MSRYAVLLAVAILAAAGFNPLPVFAGEPGKLEYNRDIRPILAENCFACHGPDSAARKAGLRLDDRESAIDKGAIEPGKPDHSELIHRIVLPSTDKQAMPPPNSHKILKPQQKEILKQWIAQGAEYQPHWSLIPPQRPDVPAIPAGWQARNPIDHFVFAELAKRGLSPNPEADRRTLARRLSLDILGLPPNPADVEEFVNDPSPDYYEKYIDKLMQSPHWGEHRGRYWLDAARYADTHGIHFDNYREMWSYREWVIQAFNRNLPFDQFTIEQLAGDLLPNPTLDQRIATGFNRCNITTNEGGIIDEEYAVLYTRDRTETVSQIWMGLTAGCAVCHDHKYDPLSQKEFYQLAAFFNNFDQPVRDGNIPNPAPVIPVPRPEDRARFEQLAQEIASAKQQLENRKTSARGDFDTWLANVKPADVAEMVPTDKLHLLAALTEGKENEVALTVNGEKRSATFELGAGYVWGQGKPKGKGLTILQSGPAIELADVGDFDADQAFSVGAWVKLSRRNTVGGLLAKMDAPANGFRGWDVWLQSDRVGMHIIHKWQDDALKVVAQTPLKPNQWYHVFVTYDGSKKAAGVKIYIDGQPQAVDVEADSLKSTTRNEVPFKIGQRHAGDRVAGASLYDLRIYRKALTGSEVGQLARSGAAAETLAKPADQRTEKERDDLYAWWLATFDKPFQQIDRQIAQLQQEEAAIKARGTIAHVSVEKATMPEAYILNRGEYDQRKEKVGPGTPEVLPPFPDDLPKNRLGFAQWLLRPEHPLTARVTVNRFWQEVFGSGLVRTAGDFGISGELPSHPELLDWLAIEFRQDWDVKRFFKLILTSATYRQSATVTPEKLAKDPQNVWLSRGPRFRMDAEMVRDHALAVSGLLVRKLGGPSVKPYQPDGVWEAVAMPESNTRFYKRDSGENLYRRSLYTFWKRSAPPAAMEVLNAPNRETCVVVRDRTNTPLQALLTLNDVQFVEAARVLAETTLHAAGSDDARINFISARLLARPFRPEELEVVKESLAELRAEYRNNPAAAKQLIAFGEKKPDDGLEPGELAAWTMLCNQLMNLDEVLNK